MPDDTSCPLGPILEETQPVDYPLDARKLPREFRRIRSYVSRDRDTGCDGEVIVTWAGHVLYRSSEMDRYPEIQARIRAMEFQLQTRNGALEMVFPDGPAGKAVERRSRDRRSGDDRRR